MEQGNVMVVGSAKGHGRAVATEFARAGFPVILLDSDPAISEVAQQIVSEGGRAASATLDVKNAASIPGVFSKTIGSARLQGLVYFPRAREEKDFRKTTPESWDQDLDVGLKGAFFCAQAAAPYLERAKALDPFILYISSVFSHLVGFESVGYHVAKAGLEQLTRFLAVRLGTSGIRVNAVQLGLALKGSPEERRTLEESEDFKRVMVGIHPLRRTGSSTDLWETLRFLASPSARFITGQTLPLEGGLTLQEPTHLARCVSKGEPT